MLITMGLHIGEQNWLKFRLVKSTGSPHYLRNATNTIVNNERPLEFDAGRILKLSSDEQTQEVPTNKNMWRYNTHDYHFGF